MPRYRGSYGAYLEVRTQAPGRQDLFDPRKLGDSDETLSERVAKCLDGDLRADQSLEPEAVCDGTGRACNARWHSLELDILHTVGPRGAAETDDAQPQPSQARRAGLVRYSEPHVGGGLRSDAVHAQRREQANDAVRHAGAGHREGVILRGLRIEEAVEAPRDVLDNPSANEGWQLIGRESGFAQLARTKECAQPGRVQPLVCTVGRQVMTRNVGILIIHAGILRQTPVTATMMQHLCAGRRFAPSIRTMSLSMLQVEGRSQSGLLIMCFLPLPDRGHGVLDVLVGLHGRIGVDDFPRRH